MSLKVKQKVFEAQEAIKQNDLKKAGFNEYSNFRYYTPEQVSLLIDTACRPLRLLNEFDLVKEDNGNLAGILTITDLESGEQDTRRMPVEIPTIKATNAIQQLGGAMTYAKRYLLQNVYDIADNSIDPDANQRPTNARPPQQTKPAPASNQKPDIKKTVKNPASKFSIADFKKMTEAKKVEYLTDLITKNQAARIPDAIKFCEQNNCLTKSAITYINIITHLHGLAPSQRADYIITCINNKATIAFSNKILYFTSKFNLLEANIIRDLRSYLKTQQ